MDSVTSKNDCLEWQKEGERILTVSLKLPMAIGFSFSRSIVTDMNCENEAVILSLYYDEIQIAWGRRCVVISEVIRSDTIGNPLKSPEPFLD